MQTSRNHLAMTPLRELPAEMTQQVAEILGMSDYDFRLRYRGWIPRSMAAYRSLEEAEKRAARLNAIGIGTLVYDERDLPPDKAFRVRIIERPGSAFEFADRQGSTVRVPWASLALMVCGKRVIEKTSKEFTTSVSLHQLTPSIKETVKREKESDLYFMLFTQGPKYRVFDISQAELDFSCLGPRQTHNRLRDFAILQAGLRQLLTHVPVDDRLLTGHRINRRDQAYYNHHLAGDASLANATLIYWERMAQAQGRLHFTAPEGTRR